MLVNLCRLSGAMNPYEMSQPHLAPTHDLIFAARKIGHPETIPSQSEANCTRACVAIYATVLTLSGCPQQRPFAIAERTRLPDLSAVAALSGRQPLPPLRTFGASHPQPAPAV